MEDRKAVAVARLKRREIKTSTNGETHQNAKLHSLSKKDQTLVTVEESKHREIHTSRNVETRSPLSQPNDLIKPQSKGQSLQSKGEMKIRHREAKEEEEEIPQQIDPVIFKKMKELQKEKERNKKEENKRKMSESTKPQVKDEHSTYSSSLSTMHRQTSFSVIGRRQQTEETSQRLSAQNFLALRRENRKSFL